MCRRRGERLRWEMRKWAQAVSSEGWWEGARWGEKELVAQHAKEVISSGQSSPLQREAVFSSPAPFRLFFTVRSQADSWEKTRDAVASHVQSQKWETGKWNSGLCQEEWKAAIHSLTTAEQSKPYHKESNPLWAETCQSARLSLLNIGKLFRSPQIHPATAVASTQMQTLSHRKRHFLYST